MPIKSKLLIRLYATRLLRVAKKRKKYKELERALGIDSTLLARYVAGSVLPGDQQARKIIDTLGGRRLLADILRSHVEEHGGYIDLVPLLADIDYLCSLSLDLALRYASERVTAILVPETSGISLASLIASHLDARLVVARRRKENPLSKYEEEHLVAPPNIRRSFYIRKNLLDERDHVLIVDDIIHSGLTLHVVTRIAQRVGASLVGVSSVVVIGNRWKRAGLEKLRVETVLEYPGLALLGRSNVFEGEREY